ncbi:LolA family protein [Paludisphaera rhizosphaerae]|uniref:LolA family protein n=1 Tax=Paludisphaera rhizosphaerae TaxID=2711216 RepID=UPI0013E9D98F|nr:hypothetical protein [Paludisphaera rhizosphaerae]
MNPIEPTPDPLDRLARAEAALKGSPSPEGPSAELVARTLAALRDADARPAPDPRIRRNPMFAMFKVAAAAVLALTAGVAYLISPRVEATTAFTEAAAKLRDARTLSYVGKMQMRQAGQERPTDVHMAFYFKDPGLSRIETGDPLMGVNVLDASQGRILALDVVNKTALVQDWKVPNNTKEKLAREAVGGAEQIRSFAGKDGQPLGRRKIGDVEAEGFRVEDSGFTWAVWVDPARKLPLLVETTVRIEGMDVALALSDFRIDPPLDDSLFQLAPPDGYRVRKLDTPLTGNLEESLVFLLRTYAEAADGSFPAKLDDSKAIHQKISKEKWAGPDDPKMIRFAQSVASSVVFIQFVLKDAYGYAPDKVKLGEPDKILFWYRPKGGQAYRAIFGDLHAEDVPVERLPEKPKF